ncbi:rab proteins geranylgeranyltransferase component A 2, partial [Reticulomyxa filosa]
MLLNGDHSFSVEPIETSRVSHYKRSNRNEDEKTIVQDNNDNDQLRDNSDDNDNAHENGNETNEVNSGNESENNGDEKKNREEEKGNERDLEEVEYLEHLQQVLTIYENKYRQILVDLIPNIIYSNESFIDILVRSEVSRYVEFRGIINHFVYFDGVNASKVPLSKGEVLASKELSINEKRQLMKFMQVM